MRVRFGHFLNRGGSMRLRNKIVTILAFLGIPFLLVAYLSAKESSVFLFVSASVVFSALTLWVLNSTVFNRIKKVTHELDQIQTKQSLSQRIYLPGDDELTELTGQINTLLDTIRLAPKEHLEKQKEGTVAAKRNPLAIEVELSALSEEEPGQNTLNQFAFYDRYIALMPSENSKNQISRFAHYDKFIALPNRVLFNELLNKAISHAKRHNKILAVLIIAVEPTNSIGPTLGNNLDEHAIKEIGNRLALSLRTEDIIAKLDGNEFIVLLNDIGKAKFASSVAKKLITACESPVQVDFQELFLRSSIGICIYPNDGYSLEDLIQKAYSALYKAKVFDSDAYQFYTEELDIEAREFSRIEADLRKAILNNELTLYYQPKLNIKSGSIVGVEALLRWMHPELGIITPGKFIQVAEDTGIIMQIGEWALREACKIDKYWQEEGYEHLSVAINLSPKQFYHPDMVKIISTVLRETGLEAHYLELEISESTVMDNPDKAIEILNVFKSMDLQISIDHFGTGYTSINHLKRFPVTVLKIDRSFIKGIPDRPDDSAIVSAIISMGHNLGMEVVAEGVETAEQVQYLTIQNCDVVQGYFLSYPLPAQKITQQFKKLMDKAIV